MTLPVGLLFDGSAVRSHKIVYTSDKTEALSPEYICDR